MRRVRHGLAPCGWWGTVRQRRRGSLFQLPVTSANLGALTAHQHSILATLRQSRGQTWPVCCPSFLCPSITHRNPDRLRLERQQSGQPKMDQTHGVAGHSSTPLGDDRLLGDLIHQLQSTSIPGARDTTSPGEQ